MSKVSSFFATFAYVLNHNRRRLVVLLTIFALILVLVWWNLGLMAQFGLHLMDRQRLSLGRNARTTFVELPLEMPSLVARYFTDRSSFYRQPRQD